MVWCRQRSASHISGIYGIPRFGSLWTESGDVRFWSLAAVVADDLVDLYDDVLGDFGLHRIAIDYLSEGYALFIILSVDGDSLPFGFHK